MNRNFFWHSLLIVSVLVFITSAASFAIGLLVHAEMQDTLAVVRDSSVHRLFTFGNSRFRTAIDARELSADMCENSQWQVIQLNGSGWNSLHYYALASILQGALHPHQDVVLIEVSPLSLDDAETMNRLDAIPPRELLQIAQLPGMPLEQRFEALGAAAFPAYRAKLPYHPEPYHTWATHAAATIWRSNLSGTGGTDDHNPPGSVQVDSPLNHRILVERRSDLASKLGSSIHFGGYKFAALHDAVRLLRDKDISVYLVQTPTSSWLKNQLEETRAGKEFSIAISELAQESGATFISQWPSEAEDGTRFEDDMHMLEGESGSLYFSRILATRLSQDKICSKYP